MIEEYFGSADDDEVAEPFRSVSPREIIDPGEGSDDGGVHAPRAPRPTQPYASESRSLEAE